MSSLTIEQRRAIDRAKENLVKAAENMLDSSMILQIKPNDLGDSQLRNLIAVASETESPAVLVNYIRYQMGRDNRGNSWNLKNTKGLSLGEQMIHEIEDGAVAEALATVPDLDDDQRQLARIELVRHFLGFTSRYLKYLGLQRGRRAS